MRTLLVISLTFLLSACATLEQHDPGSSVRIPVGSYLSLNKPLEVPRDNASLYIQYGRVMSLLDLTALQEWEPHCFLELYTLIAEPRVISPDQFEIQRVTSEVSELWVSRPVLLAYGDDGGPTQIFYRTRFHLTSPKQPDVWRMSCQIDRMEAQGLSFDRWLTVEQIRETLDGVIELTLPDDKVKG